MLLDAETLRRKLFADGVKPEFLLDPPFHVRMRLDATMNAMRDHRPVDASKLIFGAGTASATVGVVLNGTEYDTLRDADDLFGTVLEVFAKGRYFWVALEQVESLAMNPPRFPRDLIWCRPGSRCAKGPRARSSSPRSTPVRTTTPTTW